jgi:hypothetical protein
MPDDNVLNRDPMPSDPGFLARNLGVDLDVAIQGGRDHRGAWSQAFPIWSIEERRSLASLDDVKKAWP